jgi:hypothetical protein
MINFAVAVLVLDKLRDFEWQEVTIGNDKTRLVLCDASEKGFGAILSFQDADTIIFFVLS